MNAERPDRQPASQSSMKGALFKSGIFHFIIFIIALVGIPFVAKDPLIIAPVSVELVDIKDVTQTDQKPSKKVKPIPKPEEPKPPAEPPKEELKKPDPPKEEPKPKDPVPPPEPKKEEPKKEPKKPKPKKPKKPKEEPKEEKPDENAFDNLLKDLTPVEKKPDPNDQKQDIEDPEEGQLSQLADQLSISELDAFRHQIEPCWNIPSGAKYAENLAVEVRVTMARDRTVKSTRVVDQGRYSRDSAFRAAADAAVRALRNPRCSPLKLPPEKYEQWKTIVINFDPSNML